MKKAAIILLLSIFLSLLLFYVLLFNISPPQNRPQPAGISLDAGRSWFSDFMEIDDMAYSKCRIAVTNHTGAKAYVRITAEANLYDRWNLYAQKELTGYTMDMKTDVFPLEVGKNEILVYFGAPYGGRYSRSNRNLPWNIQLHTVNGADPAIDCVAQERSFGGLLLYAVDESAGGNGAFAYDFDRDGEDETVSVSKDGINYTFQLDDGVVKDALVIRSLAPPESILLHDFKFPDGSLELIVRWEGRYSGSYDRGKTEETGMDYGTSLIRVRDGELIPDLGEIYGSGGYHIEPAENYFGRLFSIAGNRVTLENTLCPIRIDL